MQMTVNEFSDCPVSKFKFLNDLSSNDFLHKDTGTISNLSAIHYYSSCIRGFIYILFVYNVLPF